MKCQVCARNSANPYLCDPYILSKAVVTLPVPLMKKLKDTQVLVHGQTANKWQVSLCLDSQQKSSSSHDFTMPSSFKGQTQFLYFSRFLGVLKITCGCLPHHKVLGSTHSQCHFLNFVFNLTYLGRPWYPSGAVDHVFKAFIDHNNSDNPVLLQWGHKITWFCDIVLTSFPQTSLNNTQTILPDTELLLTWHVLILAWLIFI